MIKFLLSISLLGALPVQAMDEPPVQEMPSIEDRKLLGRYPICQMDRRGDGGLGNVTLVQAKNSRFVVISSAHNFPDPNSSSYIVKEETFFLVGNIKKHPQYKEKENEYSNCDLALFTVFMNPTLTCFDGKISTTALEENKDYKGHLTSCERIYSQ